MEESRPPSGSLRPWVRAQAQRPFARPGSRSKPPHGETHVSFAEGSGGSSRPGASGQRAQHPPPWLISRTLRGCSVPDPLSEHPQMFFSSWGGTGPHILLP